MGLPWSARVIKYLMCGFNCLFVITGIILIALGAAVQTAYYSYNHVLDHGFNATPALFITTGAIILIISFFGCCGAYKENNCMTVTFIVFLVIIFIFELAGGIAGYMLRNRAYDVLNNALHQSLDQYNNASYPETGKFWDVMQGNLNCCGVTNSSDYLTIKSDIPWSCCTAHGLNSTALCNVNNTQLHSDGCLPALTVVVEKSAGALGGVAIFLAIIQLIGIIFACNLAKNFRQEYETV